MKLAILGALFGLASARSSLAIPEQQLLELEHDLDILEYELTHLKGYDTAQKIRRCQKHCAEYHASDPKCYEDCMDGDVDERDDRAYLKCKKACKGSKFCIKRKCEKLPHLEFFI